MTYASEKQKKEEFWNVQGIFKSRTNQLLKFDVRSMIRHEEGLIRVFSFFTKADKFAFEAKKQWIIVDAEELLEYLNNNELEHIDMEEIFKELNFNWYVEHE
jgi:hypothetical protein